VGGPSVQTIFAREACATGRALRGDMGALRPLHSNEPEPGERGEAHRDNVTEGPRCEKQPWAGARRIGPSRRPG